MQHCVCVWGGGGGGGGGQLLTGSAANVHSCTYVATPPPYNYIHGSIVQEHDLNLSELYICMHNILHHANTM